MIIPLSKNLRIRGTETCWQLEKLTTKDEWRAFKYFTAVTSALHEAAQRELRVYPTQNVAEALDACSCVTQKYAQIFDDVGRPSLRAAS